MTFGWWCAWTSVFFGTQRRKSSAVRFACRILYSRSNQYIVLRRSLRTTSKGKCSSEHLEDFMTLVTSTDFLTFSNSSPANFFIASPVMYTFTCYFSSFVSVTVYIYGQLEIRPNKDLGWFVTKQELCWLTSNYGQWPPPVQREHWLPVN